jgi:hypothetical protein
MFEQPTCAKCGVTMTPSNSKINPELFLCDTCLPVREVAERYNEGKVPLSYILHLPNFMQGLSRVYQYGAAKYSDFNWKKGNKPDTEYLDSALRHIFSWTNGEEYDKESGLNHLLHAAWNLITLFELNHNDVVMDTDKFNKAIEYWRKKKEDKKCQTNK